MDPCLNEIAPLVLVDCLLRGMLIKQRVLVAYSYLVAISLQVSQ